jgi:ATP-dependent helicase HrpA
VYRGVGLPLPDQMANAGEKVLRKFQELLARYMPFTLVIDEETANGDEARVSKTSVCGSWGAIAGELRYFADKFGNPRASIEGTQVPADFIRKYAQTGDAELIYDPERKQAALSLRRKVTYYGFELEREIEVIDAFPEDIAPKARHVLAEALARGEARHPGVHRNRVAVEEVREVYRRSAGKTPKLGMAELTAIYEQQLANVNSLSDFRHARVDVDADAIVPRAERERYAELPDTVEIRGKDVEIQYDVEENESGVVGVARLRLPEKVARNMSEAELPTLDRPLRFVVTRGMRGAARASTLDELQEELDRPFTREEIEGFERVKNRQRDERREKKRGRRESGEGAGNDDRFVRDDRKVPSERSDGRRQKPGLRAKRSKGRGGGGRGRR